ncbi:asparaginase [Actinocorallia sp. B10E7]|uniref:asparaginase n=1 Tax=Actinocorallia sp. B10E7 TaxID=3153558 RepID=UPI00325F0162
MSGEMAVCPVLVEVERSGFVESRHRGTAVALGADGNVVKALGPVDAPLFPRSTVKPFQAVAMLRHGLELEGELLALAASSHSGEAFHVEGAEKILAGAGLTAADLGCPPDWPMDAGARREALRSDGEESPLFMNCSGKHAAMLATCRANGWATETYLDSGHPLQLAVRSTLEEFTGERVAAIGVDGCGAPLYGVTLLGLARAFHRLATAPEGREEARVAAAMRTYPAWTSGTRRDENDLMSQIPGLVLKCGAEGVDAFCLPDGRAGVVKIEDGAMRARTPVTVALLRTLGVDAPVLGSRAETSVTGGGRTVGSIRIAPDLF